MCENIFSMALETRLERRQPCPSYTRNIQKDEKHSKEKEKKKNLDLCGGKTCGQPQIKIFCPSLSFTLGYTHYNLYILLFLFQPNK